MELVRTSVFTTSQALPPSKLSSRFPSVVCSHTQTTRGRANAHARTHARKHQVVSHSFFVSGSKALCCDQVSPKKAIPMVPKLDGRVCSGNGKRCQCVLLGCSAKPISWCWTSIPTDTHGRRVRIEHHPHCLRLPPLLKLNSSSLNATILSIYLRPQINVDPLRCNPFGHNLNFRKPLIV